MGALGAVTGGVVGGGLMGGSGEGADPVEGGCGAVVVGDGVAGAVVVGASGGVPVAGGVAVSGGVAGAVGGGDFVIGSGGTGTRGSGGAPEGGGVSGAAGVAEGDVAEGDGDVAEGGAAEGDAVEGGVSAAAGAEDEAVSAGEGGAVSLRRRPVSRTSTRPFSPLSPLPGTKSASTRKARVTLSPSEAKRQVRSAWRSASVQGAVPFVTSASATCPSRASVTSAITDPPSFWPGG
jgi:hypothetical protein